MGSGTSTVSVGTSPFQAMVHRRTAYSHSSSDVDDAYSPVAPIDDAATQVADELHLRPGWLNNRMQGFLPPDGINDSREFIERGGVTITLGSARTCWP